VAENLRVVYIGEMVVSDARDDVLVAYGLGSCLAVCLYDPFAKVGGMLHALLPTMPNGEPATRVSSPPTGSHGKPTKYLDQGVPLLIEALVKLGARRIYLTAKLCGGSQMLSRIGANNHLNIGELNVLAAEAVLHAAHIRIQARATGGHSGRTVKLYLANGLVMVKTLYEGEQVLG